MAGKSERKNKDRQHDVRDVNLTLKIIGQAPQRKNQSTWADGQFEKA